MAKTDNGPFDLEKVLAEEFALLHDADAGVGKLGTLYGKIHALVDAGDGRSALCLSGGGIRSASFGLGVLQALARRKLLFNFHYLSTVSGGGYIGGWLSAWRMRVPDSAVESGLTSNIPDLYDEPPELAELRANSNYLTPKLGAMSADTWTLVALYIRNLLLNWLIFLPAIAAVLLLPILSYELLAWAKTWSHVPQYWFAGAAVFLLFIALTTSVSGRFDKAYGRVTQKQFLWFILLPTYIGATFLSLSVVSKQIIVLPEWISDRLAAGFVDLLLSLSVVSREGNKLIVDIGPWNGAVIGAVLYAVAWIVAFTGKKLFPDPALKGTNHDPFPWPLLVGWTAAGAVAGCLVALGYKLIHYPVDDDSLKLIVVMGGGWVALVMFLAESAYLGGTSYSTNGDVDREWLARSSGWFVALTLGWAALAALVLYAPAIRDWVLWGVAAVGTGAGIAGSWMGASAKTAATFAGKRIKSLSMTTVLSLATVIFLAALAILISNILPGVLTDLATSFFDFPIASIGAYPKELAVVTSSMIVACALLVIGIAVWVNVNRFSSHAIYRNRLIRAFLGAARAETEKSPGAIRAVPKESPTRDPFTGFDAKDNLRMTALMRPDPAKTGEKPRLFHVVNMALNVVGGRNLAWQERKAESFVTTPKMSGNDNVGFWRTEHYGSSTGGLTLGTAMAISGASASPNQGYHSSPLVGLLMTLFNVRLGWWLGNPSRPNAAELEGPHLGIVQIIQELFGLTSDRSKYIYLSDGGHFENLGIYEMVRRRCHLIVASDAGCDPACAFEDLGNAVRKVAIDLGVKIDFHKIDIKKRDADSPGLYCAIGTIKYPEPDAKNGYLLYLKPGFPGDGSLPADVNAYGLANPTFPHETTVDQFFSESQMESYRSLGAHIIDVVFGPEDSPPRLFGPTTAMTPFWEHIEEYVSPKTKPGRKPGLRPAVCVMGPGDQLPRPSGSRN
jgi:hypothetical protein